MQNYKNIIDGLGTNGVYTLAKHEKHVFLTEALKSLSVHHYDSCSQYKKIIDALEFDVAGCKSYYELPFLPVRLFKQHSLKSIPEQDIIKTMTSSGTTGQAVSRIFLDKDTAASQQKILVKIVSEFIGGQRIPMLIIDSPDVIKDRNMFSARGAGILGFSIFGSDKAYALNEKMEIDIDAVKIFLEKHKDKKILLFGFTFMIWQHFYQELAAKNIKLDLKNGILFHGGGWKKLIANKVSQIEFKQKLNEVCGIKHVHDYYGMVEQTGSIYVECGEGHLHCSDYSDIIVRDPHDFSVCEIGKKGIIQAVSVLPYSYPGHSLLTEDEGIILGEDNCPCGKKGKYFAVLGRIANAELRGCSDTYAAGR